MYGAVFNKGVVAFFDVYAHTGGGVSGYIDVFEVVAVAVFDEYGVSGVAYDEI